EMQLTGRGRYEWMAGDFDAYAQVGIQYVDDSINSLVAADSEVQDGYTTADLSFGLGRGEWRASVFVENVTDERAELFINNQDDIRRITTNRPRTVTFRIAADF
ncbi:MAG: TonB-dependent receptor, partial [Maricaulis sp.]|nr:TonB-dependent receptor [Maricaulis sp.]